MRSCGSLTMLHPAPCADPSLVPNVVQIAAVGQDPRKAALLEHDLDVRAIVERTIRRPGPPVRPIAVGRKPQAEAAVNGEQVGQTRRGRARLRRTVCVNVATGSVDAPAPCIRVETTFETRSRRGNEAERAAHNPADFVLCFLGREPEKNITLSATERQGPNRHGGENPWLC